MKFGKSHTLFVLLAVFHLASAVRAQSLIVNTYDIGSPILTNIYVDGTTGSDANDGLSPSSPLRTPDAAWRRIPEGAPLAGSGYRVLLSPGNYPESSLPNYWESRYGSYSFPIIFQPLEAPGSVTFQGDINLFDTRYFYLIDINIIPEPAGDAFHCERCSHILLRRVVLSGGARQAHETVKVNQSRHIYIEDSNIHGADDNAIDFVAVQYGHIVRNRIHNAEDWCAYVKGGSAYILVEGNEIFDCGTGGFTAGQGVGFEFMTAPWLHYEATDIKFVNNIIHDTDGAAFGVNGGYNILMAHNTAYQVGRRDHVIEVVFGNRSCDGDGGRCNALRLGGGWGPGSVQGDFDDVPIPNKHIWVFNNIIYNPLTYASPPQIFAIYGPRIPRAGLNIPSPAVTDEDLRIRGNLIWSNGAGGTELGAGGEHQGCQSANPTCNAAQITVENTINTIEPQLMNPGGIGTERDLRPTAGSSVFIAAAFPPADFPGGDRPVTPIAPEGNLVNEVSIDRGGEGRVGSVPVPGAYLNSTSPRDPVPGTPGAPGGDSPSGGGGSGDRTAPMISRVKAPKRARVGKTISIEAVVRDDVQVSGVVAQVGDSVTELRRTGKASKGRFRGKVRVRIVGALTPIVTATDTSGNQSQAAAGAVRVR